MIQKHRLFKDSFQFLISLLTCLLARERRGTQMPFSVDVRFDDREGGEESETERKAT